MIYGITGKYFRMNKKAGVKRGETPSLDIWPNGRKNTLDSDRWKEEQVDNKGGGVDEEGIIGATLTPTSSCRYLAN